MPSFQVRGICFLHSYSMVKTNNEEIGNLPKPRRVSLGYSDAP